MVIVYCASVRRIDICLQTTRTFINYFSIFALHFSFPWTILITSGFFTSNPSALINTFNSCKSMVPVLLASNNSNASRSSCFWSSDNSGLFYNWFEQVHPMGIKLHISYKFNIGSSYLLTLILRCHFFQNSIATRKYSTNKI